MVVLAEEVGEVLVEEAVEAVEEVVGEAVLVEEDLEVVDMEAVLTVRQGQSQKNRLAVHQAPVVVHQAPVIVAVHRIIVVLEEVALEAEEEALEVVDLVVEDMEEVSK